MHGTLSQQTDHYCHSNLQSILQIINYATLTIKEILISKPSIKQWSRFGLFIIIPNDLKFQFDVELLCVSFTFPLLIVYLADYN